MNYSHEFSHVHVHNLEVAKCNIDNDQRLFYSRYGKECCVWTAGFAEPNKQSLREAWE